MTKKSSSNILLLSLILILSLMVFIPTGIRHGWPLWLYFLSIAVLCSASCISWWNSDYAFSPLPLDKMTKRDKVMHFMSFTIMIIGFDFMLGMFGDGRILVIIGCIIVLAFSLVQRHLAKTYGKGPEENQE